MINKIIAYLNDIDPRKMSKILIIVFTAIVAPLVLFFVYSYINAPGSVQTLTVEAIKRPELVAEKIGVSPAVAKEIVREIEKAKPVQTYTVPAKEAEKKVQEIAKDKPADKTIIVPEEKKIEVYKINLDKPRAIGVYASTESAGAIVQYKKVAVFGGPKYKGGYEIGAAYMVRW